MPLFANMFAMSTWVLIVLYLQLCLSDEGLTIVNHLELKILNILIQ